MNSRAFASMIVGLLIPGAGHFLLGRKARGLAFLVIIGFMFAIGLSIDGGIYTFAESRGSLLRVLASLGSMGSGILYFGARAAGTFGDVTSATFEYGTTFTLTAGLMNLLLVLDCFDIAKGRKH